MKNKKLLLLSLLSLSLVGCEKNSTVTPSNKPTASEAPISNRVDDKKSTKDTTKDSTKDTTKDTASVSKDSDKTSSSTVTPDPKPDTGSQAPAPSTKPSDSTSPSASESSESSDIYANTKWKKDVVDLMVKNLGGTILPYVDLGTKVIPTWDQDKTTLTLMGNDTTGMTQAKLNVAKADYEADGYTVTITGTKMTAISSAKGLTVNFYDADGILELDAIYAEPFDPTMASAWPQEIIDDLNLNIANHAADLPFVYLGTANPTGSMSTYAKKYTITGGKWDDQVVTLAKTAFTAANNSITDSAYKWSITTSTNSYGPTFSANVTLSDGTKMQVKIEAPYTSSYTSGKATMEITFTEPFIVPASGAWTQDILDQFNANAHGHIVPYFYMGTLAPTVTYLSYSKEIDIKGGTWDDQILTLCETALNNENKTITADSEKWVVTKSADQVKADRDFSDGCSLSLTLSKNYSDIPLLEVVYHEGYLAPQGADWTATTKQAFVDHLDGNTVPYVYLATTSETASWDDNYSTLTIKGDTYFDNVLKGGLASFQAAGWTASIETITETDDDYYSPSTYSYKVMQAEKVLNPTTGSKLSAVLTGTYVSSYSGKVSGSCQLSVQYTKPYTPPTGDDAKWDDTTDQYVKNHLEGHTIPYVYLNSDTIKTASPTSYNSTSTVNLTGGIFTDMILTQAQTAYADWTNPTIANSVFTASKVEADGCKITVTIKEDSNGLALLTAVVTPAFNASAATDWTDDMKTAMKNCLNGNVIPYINLGCATPSYTEYKSSNNITIRGKVWDDQIFTLAETNLTNLGWDVFYDVYSSTYALYAFNENADGSYFGLKLNSSSSTSSTLDVYYYAPETVTKGKTDWSDADKTFLNTYTGNHADKVPFAYMGDGDYTYQAPTSSTGAKVTGTAFSLNEAFVYLKALKKAGYTDFGFYMYSSSLTVTAKYTDPTGYSIEIKFDYDGYGTSKKRSIAVTYTDAFVVPSGDDAKWSDDINTALTNFIGDNIALPYIYLGTLAPTMTQYSSGKEIDIIGASWDDKVIDVAYNAFKNSTDGWEVAKNGYDNQVLAFLTTPSGHAIKVIVKKNGSDKVLIEVYKK